jgi:NADH dehydrogenase
MAGSCAELARRTLRPEFRLANLSDARVILLDAGPRVLPSFPESLSAHAHKDLERMGVRVVLNSKVSDISDSLVVTDHERFDAGTIIWAAGVSAPPLTRDLAPQGVELDRSGRILVGPDLRLPNHPEVFVVGDIANCTDAANTRVPGSDHGGMQSGRQAGRAIIAALAATSIPPFTYHDNGTMATIGRSRAVADFGKTHATGTIAWLMWLLIHLLFLIDLRSKLTVILKWIAAYIFYRPSSRLIENART